MSLQTDFLPGLKDSKLGDLIGQDMLLKSRTLLQYKTTDFGLSDCDTSESKGTKVDHDSCEKGTAHQFCVQG